jgi:hypothetical protein
MAKVKSLTVFRPAIGTDFNRNRAPHSIPEGGVFHVAGASLNVKVEGPMVVTYDDQKERREFHGFPFEILYDTSEEEPTSPVKS